MVYDLSYKYRRIKTTNFVLPISLFAIATSNVVVGFVAWNYSDSNDDDDDNDA